MTFAQLLMAGVVFLLLIPSALRNSTAAALAGQYLVVQGLWMTIHASVPAGLLLLSDIFVLGVIWSKPPVTEPPYTSLGHIWRERSWFDRGVILGFPACWATYVFMGSDWWCLYGVSLAQMFLSVGEPLSGWLAERLAAVRERTNFPPNGSPFAIVGEMGRVR